MLKTISTLDLADVHGGQVADVEKSRAAFNASVRRKSLAQLGYGDFEAVQKMPKIAQLDACDRYFPGSREDDSRTGAPTERNKMIDLCVRAGFGF